MSVIKVLGIAPYEGMKNLLLQVAAHRKDIDLTVFIGDRDAGRDIAQRYTESDFDVILSRGGTAELIRQCSSIPVVDISLSVYDILRSIKLAENHDCGYAIIGFPAITKNAAFLCQVLRYDISIYTIHNEAEARSTLQKLEAQNCKMVLCDVVTNSLAHEFGIPAILIASGVESVESAVDQAVQECAVSQALRAENSILKLALREQPQSTFLYDVNHSLLFSSSDTPFPPAVKKRMQSFLETLSLGEERNARIEADNRVFNLRAECHRVGTEQFLLLTVVSHRLSLSLEKHGISHLNRQEAVDSFFSSFYGITQSTAPAAFTLEQYSHSTAPLIIVGEKGTAKDPMVRLLYAKGPYCEMPLVLVDCARLGVKGWQFLLENDHSPLLNSGEAIMLFHMDALTDVQFEDLCSTIQAFHSDEKNQYLISASYRSIDQLDVRYQKFIDRFGCHTLFMPPLRNHLQDIPSLASLYISTLNLQTAKSVIGFEPDALRLIQSYRWPGNYDQFKRVLSDLVQITDTPYISTESVRSALKRENVIYQKESSAQSPLDLTRTLAEINLQIVESVLAEEKGSLKKTSDRLGISRSTLWRMLQRK